MYRSDCTILVRTGDQKGASTDVNVFIILHDERGIVSPQYKLDNFLWGDFKCGAIDKFEVKLPANFGTVSMIEFWHDNAGISADWYVDMIKIERVRPKTTNIFPIFRWIDADDGNAQNHYRIYELDTILPQFDPNPQQREKEIERKREHYVINYNEDMPDMPVLVKELPADEKFSFKYIIYVLLNTYLNLFIASVKRILIAIFHYLDGRERVLGKKRKKPQVLPHSEVSPYINEEHY